MNIYSDYFNEILGYYCDNNEIREFRVLRYPFSQEIESFDDEEKNNPKVEF